MKSEEPTFGKPCKIQKKWWLEKIYARTRIFGGEVHKSDTPMSIKVASEKNDA